jgi:acyl-CoA synthetase (AMP-forming)/AMP-acid ligase II
LVVPANDSAEVAAPLVTKHNATILLAGPDYTAKLTRHFEVLGLPLRAFQFHTGAGAVAQPDPVSGDYRFLSANVERLVPARHMPVPPTRIPSYFGMTETLAGHSVEPIPTLMPEGKKGASGRPLPGVERKIVDPVTQTEVPAGTVGELYVRTPSLMAGLYKQERREVFDPDGFYPTGDLCVIDENDCLTFTARLGEMVKVSGANVAPLEVEQTLRTLPGVEACAVLGLPTKAGGSTLVAAIVADPSAGLTEIEIRAGVKPLLSSYKIPKRVVFLRAEELPVTPNGKVRKKDLAEHLAQLLLDHPAE